MKGGYGAAFPYRYHKSLRNYVVTQKRSSILTMETGSCDVTVCSVIT
jgi:hypothetical protein